MKITFEIYDTDKNGGIAIVANPAIAELALKAHRDNITAAEALAMHLARKALEYSKRMREEASPIVLPSSTTSGIETI